MERESSLFLRALRERRSQISFARRLGYVGNPITSWERGKRFPTAVETLRAAAAQRHDVASAFAAFAPTVALPFEGGRPSLSAWLDALRGSARGSEIARRCGCTRFSVRRWLNGESEPRLPDFFRLIDAMTGRLPEWVAAFVPIQSVPSLVERYQRAMAAKRVAFDAPWSEAVVRLLELEQYAQLKRHSIRGIAESLGVERNEIERAVTLLGQSGVIREARGRYVVSGEQSVDTQGGEIALRRLKAHWARVALERLQTRAPGTDVFAYNVISVADADLGRVREILRGAFREIRSLVVASEPAQAVALVNLQLVKLGPEPAG